MTIRQWDIYDNENHKVIIMSSHNVNTEHILAKVEEEWVQ